jgi:hypothetical protein
VGAARVVATRLSITVRENDVEVELLWPGVPEWSDYSPLRYQTQIDRVREWVVAHRLEEAREKVRERRMEAEAGLGGEW